MKILIVLTALILFFSFNGFCQARSPIGQSTSYYEFMSATGQEVMFDSTGKFVSMNNVKDSVGALEIVARACIFSMTHNQSLNNCQAQVAKDALLIEQLSKKLQNAKLH